MRWWWKILYIFKVTRLLLMKKNICKIGLNTNNRKNIQQPLETVGTRDEITIVRNENFPYHNYRSTVVVSRSWLAPIQTEPGGPISKHLKLTNVVDDAKTQLLSCKHQLYALFTANEDLTTTQKRYNLIISGEKTLTPCQAIPAAPGRFECRKPITYLS